MLMFFALVFYFFLQASLIREIDAQLRGRAALVGLSFDSGEVLEDQTISVLSSSLVEFAAPGIYVELLDLNGQVRAVSPNLSDSRLPIRLDLLSAARSGHTMIDTVKLDAAEELRLLVAPLGVNTASGCMLLVAESLKPLQRTLAQARALLLVCGAVTLALAVGGAALMTAQSLAPMARLTRTAANVAETGHYHERVPIPRYQDEVGQLAITLNKLIATVEQTLAQQRRFVADTSHELRSPLTVVLANLNLLCRDLGADERALSLQEATAEAQRMRRLVNDLLLLAQADTAQAMAHTHVQLHQLVEESVSTAVRQAPKHCFQLRVEAPVVMMGDQERLTQLLRNLLENATHHTPPGTDIEVRLRRSDAVAQIVVSDTGMGIAAEHLPHIWNRFYRVDKARSRASGSTGLGLAIVQYVTEAHGGSVKVVSQVGKGTTFTITLPVVPTDGMIPDDGLSADSPSQIVSC
jgi:signal transduction histidine kinase